MSSNFLRLLAAAVVLNLFVFAIIGLTLYRSHYNERQEATLVADNLSRVLEENLSRFIDKIDLTLMAMLDEIEREERAGGIDRATLEAFIARHDARLPEALGLRVVNAAGRIEYAVSNLTLAGGNDDISDRDHFVRLRGDSTLGLFVSRPFVGRLNPQPLVIVARRRTAADGSFAGIVHVAVAIGSLQRMFASVDLGPHGSVGLWDDGPALVARFTRAEGVGTEPAVPSATLRELVRTRHPATAYHTRSLVDGIERVFFYRKVGQWPLHLVVGVADRDYMVAWWREVRLLGGLAVMFMLASAAAAIAIARVMRALENARAEAEAARRRSDLVLASAGEGICGIDGDGRVTFINAAARRLLGWGEDEGPGWDFHAVAHHHHADGRAYAVEDCPATRVMAAPAPAMPRHVDGEVYWRKDGTSFPVEYTVAPIVEGGQRKGAVNVFRDIGERLRVDRERARTLAVTQALGNILRLSLDSMSLDRMLDAALGELLSLSWLPLERQGCIFLIGPTDGSLRMAAQRNLPPPIRAACATVAPGQCLCGRAAVEGAVVFAGCVDDHHTTGYDDMPAHGHYCVPIGTASERLGVLNAYVAHGHRRDPDEERFLRMVADTLAGMIKRKRVEETLKTSDELATALLDAPADAAFLLDRDGVVLAGNEAFASRFGRTIDAMVGQPFFDLLPPELAAQRRAQLDLVLIRGEPLEAHDERDGRALDNRIFPVLDAHGAVARVAVFSRDVTEQRMAAQAVEKALAELARSNEELQQFAYVASHDLRAPLRMVSSYLGLIERRLGPSLEGDIKEFMDFAIGGAKRMDRLIVDLLDYSRSGRGTDPFAPVALGDAVADAMLNLRVAIAEAAADIVVSDLPHVLGDVGELTRLFQNLIGNAVKYRARGRPARVEIGWRPEDGECRIWVRDNGIGIAAEDRERAFRIFQRLAPDDGEGTGIGLAVCRKIVDHHGGRIWIESVPGEGSTFVVALPGPVAPNSPISPGDQEDSGTAAAPRPS